MNSRFAAPTSSSPETPLGQGLQPGRCHKFLGAHRRSPGRMLYALPLAAYGIEHFTDVHAVAAILPAWAPWHTACVYLAGAALISAGIAISADVWIQKAAAGLVVLFLTFTAIIHIPNLIVSHGAALIWVLMLRDLGLLGAALILACALPPSGNSAWRRGRTLGRTLLGLALIGFGLQALRSPAFWPGIPEVARALPAWIPAHGWLAYGTAVAFLAGGTTLALRLHEERVAVALGLLFLALAVLIFVPVFVSSPGQRLMVGNTIAMYAAYAGALFIAAAAPSAEASQTR